MNSFGFETKLADSLLKEARMMGSDRGVEFMLEQFYNVFNKSYEDGILWGETTLDAANSIGNKQFQGRAALSLSAAWYLRGDYEKSFEFNQKALSIFEEIEDQCYIGRTHNERSVYYRKQKQYHKALKSLDIAYKKCIDCGDSACVETSLNNRGVIYEMMGDFDKAVIYYMKARNLAVKIKNDLGLSYIYNNLAEAYRLKQEYDSSAWYIERSSEIRRKMDDKQGLAINIINLGDLFCEMGAYDKAIVQLNEGIKIAEEVKYTDLLKHAHLLLSKSYKGKNDIEKSLFHLERSYELKDSLLNEDKLEALSEMEVKYETAKIQKGLIEEEQRRTKAELTSSNKTKWIYVISSSGTALIFLSLFLYQRKLKKTQAEKDKAILEEREKGLEAVIDATEEERQRIARDLHDGVGQQMSGIKLAWQNLSVSIKNKNGEETDRIDQISQILDEAAQEVRNISHQMMPKVLSEFGLIPAIEEMLEKSLNLSLIQYEFEHFNINERFDKRIEISLYRIAQELINNVIKHSGANQVVVQLFKNKKQLILIVEDNGKGIDNKNIGGHGLLNIKSRLNTIHGHVNYEASENAGTVATVRIDLE